MIPFFVGYAVLVWVFAARWRRQARAVAVLALGMAGLLGVCWAHYRLALYARSVDPEGQGIYRQVFQSIMYPYTALVGAVGLFLAALPRGHPPEHCAVCGYDLRGLGRPARACPECGEDPAPDAPRQRYRASGSDRDDLTASDLPASDLPAPLPAQHAVGHAPAQDERR